jgi:hypothetical protein
MDANLGTCCVCGQNGVTVRNIYSLHQKCPTPGKGWGCVVCGLPSDGAIAVVCDECHKRGAQLKFACAGYPGIDGRVPVESLEGYHDHDLTKHAPSEHAYNN